MADSLWLLAFETPQSLRPSGKDFLSYSAIKKNQAL
jgi:hypothetical protein